MTTTRTRSYGIVGLIMVFWFVISFITNIMGPLIPDIISNFKLSHLWMAGFIPTSFFLAYAVMSIPAGIMIEKWSEKTVLLIGFSMPLLASLLFALAPKYEVLLVSCFIIGLGMAMLQTVINPLKRVAGGEENFAFFSVLGQLVFGLASFVSPFVYSYLVTALSAGGAAHGALLSLLSKVTPPELPWVSLYWVFAMVLAVIIVVVALVSFPKIKLEESEKSGSLSSYLDLLKNKYVILFFFGIFAYVATEQGIANWIAEFLRAYHNVPPVDGVKVVGWFWGAMSVGCLVGLLAMKLFDVRDILKVAAVGAIAFLIIALLGSTKVAMVAFPLIAFFISVMFSSIMSTGLNSVSNHHGSFAGILCSGIAGGAVGPLVVGALADIIGLQWAMLFIVVPLAYILSIGFWARPLINNKTISLRKKK